MESLPYSFQKRQYWEYYCPICKILRRTVYWPAPRKRHYIQLLLAGLALTTMLWPWFGPRGAVGILPIWVAFEFIYRSRARQSMICHNCGFDPYLYKFDVQMARKKVEAFYSDREKRKVVKSPTS